MKRLLYTLAALGVIIIVIIIAGTIFYFLGMLYNLILNWDLCHIADYVCVGALCTMGLIVIFFISIGIGLVIQDEMES